MLKPVFWEEISYISLYNVPNNVPNRIVPNNVREQHRPAPQLSAGRGAL